MFVDRRRVSTFLEAADYELLKERAGQLRQTASHLLRDLVKNHVLTRPDDDEEEAMSTSSAASKHASLPPALVDAIGVATLLGVSLSTVRKLDAKADLPHALRIGKRKLWSVDEIRAWAAAGVPNREAWETMKR